MLVDMDTYEVASWGALVQSRGRRAGGDPIWLQRSDSQDDAVRNEVRSVGFTLLNDGIEDHVTTTEQKCVLPELCAAISITPGDDRIDPGMAQLN
jgi:hypothetical protein